jgi:hypothetical protein
MNAFRQRDVRRRYHVQQVNVNRSSSEHVAILVRRGCINRLFDA